jgi:2,3-dihydroxybenzoate-AMP ligase
MNIVEPIFAQCRNKPSELALCAPGTEFNLVSYARLERSVDNICRRIIAAGIMPHSRIAVTIEDPILHAMTVIALTRLGVITVSAGDRPVQWLFKLDGAIADREYESLAGKTVLQMDAGWTEGDDQPLAEKHLYRAAPDDLCRIFLLPGNDQRRHAIAMTHGMVATRLDRQKLFLGPRAPFCDRTHLDLPLGRPIGFQALLGTLWRGGALVMTWDVRKTLAALAAYKVQNVVATPQSLLKFADAVESHPGYCSTLAAAFSVRAMGSELSAWVRAHLCPNLTIGYVAPDATMVASMPAQFASVDPGAKGFVLPGVTVEIVDDQDHALPFGQNGNLRIRSEYGVKEYFEDADATRRAFRNGWFYPGHHGCVTADNMLVLSGGDAVEPATDLERVERILSKHTNVVQCGVVATASEIGVQELSALIVPRSYFDLEALRSYCSSRLPSGLVPARFVAVSDLPRSEDGRIDRAKLPELLKSQLH